MLLMNGDKLMSDFNHFIICLLAICMSSLGKYSSPGHIYVWVIGFFVVEFCECFYRSCISTHYLVYCVQIFSLIQESVFFFNYSLSYFAVQKLFNFELYTFLL